MKNNKDNEKLKKNLKKEFRNITYFLFNQYLCQESNEFSETYNKLTWSQKDTTISNILFDKNISLQECLETLRENNQYNILMKDRSLFQIEYEIENAVIIKQRMLYIKSSNEIIDNTSEESINFEEEEEKKDELPILIRVDYDIKNHKDIKHPASHMTINNIENCRIPIKSNMSFLQFVKFILLNIYGINYDEKEIIFNEDTITDNEKKCIHFNWL